MPIAKARPKSACAAWLWLWPAPIPPPSQTLPPRQMSFRRNNRSVRRHLACDNISSKLSAPLHTGTTHFMPHSARSLAALAALLPLTPAQAQDSAALGDVASGAAQPTAATDAEPPHHDHDGDI